MKKIILFLFNGMTDYEITFVTHLLKTEGNCDIVTTSYDDKFVKGKSGLEYKINKLVKDILDDDYDGLIIPGGWYGELREEFKELIWKFNSKGKLLAGICGSGTCLLAKSGVLKDKKYTTPIVEWMEEHRKSFGGDDPFNRDNYINKITLRDNNIITAKAEGFIDFAIEICDWFNLFIDYEDKINFIKLFKVN